MSVSAPPRNSAGFTLLEAIVAITLVAIALLPLVGFIAQATNQLQRAADSNERSFAMQSALALMEPINPLLEPEGELPLDDDIKVAWQSVAVVPPNDTVVMGGSLGTFRLGFYQVHVTVSHRDAPEWLTFDVRKVGYDRFVSPFSLDGRR